jgi:hypothetical protein
VDVKASGRLHEVRDSSRGERGEVDGDCCFRDHTADPGHRKRSRESEPSRPRLIRRAHRPRQRIAERHHPAVAPGKRCTAISPDSASTTQATTFAACTPKPTQVRTLVTVGSSYAVVAAARSTSRAAIETPTIACGTGQLLRRRPDDNLHRV